MKAHERILGYPIYLLGKLIDRICMQKNESKVFFFFPFYHTGGAERVHTDILRELSLKKPWVIVVNKSQNEHHKSSMMQYAKLIDIGRFFHNWVKFFVKNFFIGYYSSLINRHKSSILISSLNGFFTDIVPYVKDAYKIEIIHGFYGIEPIIHIRPTKYLDKRILVSKNSENELHKLYDDWGVDSRYKQRTSVIHNAVQIPIPMPVKKYDDGLKVVFIGRNSREKRYYLYERIAAECKENGFDAQFYSIGRFKASKAVISIGEICTREELYRILSEFHILILCSLSEGFPIVILEAMACALVPISTNVGGVAEVISDGVTGNLLNSSEDDVVVSEIVCLLNHYCKKPHLLQEMGIAAYTRVMENFNYETFGEKYRALIKEAFDETS